MAGPVWRFEANLEGTCDSCLRSRMGMFVEGEVVDNKLERVRVVCSDCLSRTNGLAVSGEIGGRAKAPAYARDP
jgi:hypothetical protein